MTKNQKTISLTVFYNQSLQSSMTKHALFVCKSCLFSLTEREYMGQRGGFHLLNHLTNHYQSWALKSEFIIQETQCLSACNRPCVIAFSAFNKTTLMFGDLPPLDSAIDILQLGEKYYASSDGIIARQARPDVLKKGILARIPPLPQCELNRSLPL